MTLAKGQTDGASPAANPQKIIFAKKWICRTRFGIFELFHQERKSLIAARWHRVQHRDNRAGHKNQKKKKVFFAGVAPRFFFSRHVSVFCFGTQFEKHLFGFSGRVQIKRV